MNRRSFLRTLLIGLFGFLTGQRALAQARTTPSLPLTDVNLTQFLANAHSRGTQGTLLREALANLSGFLERHFVVTAAQRQTLARMSADRLTRIQKALKLAHDNNARLDFKFMTLPSRQAGLTVQQCSEVIGVKWGNQAQTIVSEKSMEPAVLQRLQLQQQKPVNAVP
jgi:hypothetical protein